MIESLDLNIAGGTENLTVASSTNVEMPCVMLSINDPEETKGLTQAGVQTTFSVQVYILDRDSGELEPEDEDKYMRWRELLMARFNRPKRDANGERLPGCREVNGLSVSPRFVFDKTLPQYQYVMTGFVVKAKASLGRI